MVRARLEIIFYRKKTIQITRAGQGTYFKVVTLGTTMCDRSHLVDLENTVTVDVEWFKTSIASVF